MFAEQSCTCRRIRDSRAALGVRILAATLMTASILATTTEVAAASPPPCQAPPLSSTAHGYTEAYSGYGGNVGTEVNTYTWSTWTVPNPSQEFSNAATWQINNNNWTNSIEAGIRVGANEYGQYTTQLIPYYTLNNGQYEYDFWSDILPRSQSISMSIWQNGYSNAVVAGHWLLSGSTYYVGAPRLNYSQAEVRPWDAGVSMSGGNDTYWGYYLPPGSSTWIPWGYNTVCADNPYWVYSYGGNAWKSGGQ